jgi:hypothetical protein
LYAPNVRQSTLFSEGLSENLPSVAQLTKAAKYP